MAILASASTWFYANRILRAQQIEDARIHQRPRGNLSDLYPRWLGARELLRNHRNPYSSEVTQEIQQGYYGRPLDPNRADDPKDQQGFVYPAYVVFLMAPTVDWPFERVQSGFRWLLFGLAVVSVVLWFRVLTWRPSILWIGITIILVLGWLPMVQGIKLQQLSLLVAGLLAIGTVSMSSGWLGLAGICIALATVKPQLAWPIVGWLLLWTLADFRSRRRFFVGFLATMIGLFGAAEFLLPGWPRMFLDAVRQYHQYTLNQSVLVWMFGQVLGHVAEGLAVLGCAVFVWQNRKEDASSAEFGRTTALVLGLTVLIVPMFAPYNQVLLLPAVLSLVRSAMSKDPMLPVIRVSTAIGGLLLVWPWIASIALSAAYPWLSPAVRQRVWPMPFYSNFLLPVFVFGLALLDAWTNPAYSLRDGTMAE